MVRMYGCDLLVVRRIFVGFVLALLFQATPIWAQSEAVLRGQVVAAQDNSPLPGTVVSVKSVPAGDARQTTTDVQGWFVFTDLRPGEYLLSSARDGFASAEIRLVLKPREIRALTVAPATRLASR